MKKVLFFLALCVSSIAIADNVTLYLNTGGSSLWNQANAVFYVWHWGTNISGAWSDKMTLVDGDLYKVEIPSTSNNVIFCRMNPSKTRGWDAVWNRTDDLKYGEYDTFTITGWGSDKSQGKWSKSSSSGKDDEDVSYGSQAPQNCKDIILQAFYYDSYESSGTGKVFGDTKWATLLKQEPTISKYFDMVWLPPSAMSSGGTGYIPRQYSNQSSDWGSDTQLKKLIDAFHTDGTKVMADVVINHLGNSTGWCNFFVQDFGTYGSFQPDGTWITKNDEVNTDPAAPTECRNKSEVNDDGYDGPQDFGGVRDLAHNKAEVREMCRAYLKWMKEEVGYDAWRYDFAKGFHGSHENDYNKYSGAYFSVVEYWDGVDAITNFLKDASWNTYAFDFPTKYKLNTGIGDANYTDLLCSGLICGYSNYAVTFVDNHDTFRRDNGDGKLSDNGEFMGNNGSIGNYANRTVQAYAFILSMPGVPCVFYPHWYTFKEQIKKLCDARHRAGIHSGSSCSDEAGDGYYKATITGTGGGSIKLFIGPNSNYGDTPSGYTAAYVGENCGVYYKQSSDYVEKKDDIDENVTVKVGFKKPTDWTEVAAYAWNSKGAVFGDWPGTKQTVSEDGWVMVEIPSGSQIIFNNNKSTGTVQTVDSDELTADICFTLGSKNSEGKYTLQEAEGCLPIEYDEFYLIGYLNGDDVTAALDEYKFDAEGKLTTSFTQPSYVYFKNESTDVYYMSKKYYGEGVTSGTFYVSEYGSEIKEKMYAPAGKKLNYSLVSNGDNTYTLSYTISELATELEQTVLGEKILGIYNAQGMYVGDQLSGLPSGMYILRTEEQNRKVLLP